MYTPGPAEAVYRISKVGLKSLVQTCAVELAPHGIRVNSIAPGLVVTPLTARVLEHDPAALDWMRLHTPNGQVPGPEACGSAAVFLLSDEAEHIHGQTLLIDGGMSVWQQPDMPQRYRQGYENSGGR